jgi:hypothetical protein
VLCRTLPIIATLGERKLGVLSVSLRVVPFFPPSPTATQKNPSPPISPSNERSFQHYERLAAADESRLPLYPSPVASGPINHEQRQHVQQDFAELISSPVPKESHKTRQMHEPTNVPVNNIANRATKEGVIADLFQRGLKLRDAMANSARGENSLTASSALNSKHRTSPLFSHSNVDDLASPNIYTEQLNYGRVGEYTVDDSLDAVRVILAAQDCTGHFYQLSLLRANIF